MTADPTAFVLGGRGGLRRRDRGALRTWAGLRLVAVLVVIPLRGLYRFTGGTMEEGFMLYFPERMAKGDVPNVDFLHLYGPGSLHVLMAWYELFGNTLAVERTFGLLQHVAIILALFTLARPWGRIGRHARRRLRRVLRADADRADGDGLERRSGPHAVVRGVRRALDVSSADGPSWSPESSPVLSAGWP